MTYPGTKQLYCATDVVIKKDDVSGDSHKAWEAQIVYPGNTLIHN